MDASNLDEITPAAPPRSAGALFWILVLMAMAVLVPSILLPEWRQVQALRVAEATQEARVARMEDLLENERRLLDGIRRDPAVVERAVQRDLNFRPAGHDVIPVAGAETGGMRTPPWIASSLGEDPPLTAPDAVWPSLKWDRIFCARDTRPVLITMSVALLAAAALLYGRRAAS